MHKIYHVEILQSAVGNQFSDQALDQIISANLGQDSLLNLLKGHFHFDGNGYKKAYRYVEEQEAALLSSLADEDLPAAWAAFGRLTHSLQDFYAHTNYIELWRAENPDADLKNGQRVAPLVEHILDSKHLYAAWVYYPLEALTIFPALIPRLKKLLPADSHVNMNLDSPESGENFDFAMSAAIRRTQIACEEIFRTISEKLGQAAVQQFTGLNAT